VQISRPVCTYNRAQLRAESVSAVDLKVTGFLQDNFLCSTASNRRPTYVSTFSTSTRPMQIREASHTICCRLPRHLNLATSHTAAPLSCNEDRPCNAVHGAACQPNTKENRNNACSLPAVVCLVRGVESAVWCRSLDLYHILGHLRKIGHR
jgi:hypothetical protein